MPNPAPPPPPAPAPAARGGGNGASPPPAPPPSGGVVQTAHPPATNLVAPATAVATATPVAVTSTLAGVRLPITKVSEYETGRYLNVLVYGAPGVGKTYMAGMAPRPVLFLDIDQGTLSVRHMEDVHAMSIRSYADMLIAINTLSELFNQRPGIFSTVVFDNMTEFQGYLRNSQFNKRGGEAILQTQDWGVMLLQMETIVGMVKQLPCHKIFIAHEETRDGYTSLALQGQMKTQIPGKFDLIFRLVMGQVDQTNEGGVIERVTLRKLITQPTPSSLGKDRSGRLAPYEDPDINTIIRKIFG